MFQSNMTKSTLDGNCMAKKMLIVMLTTNPAIGEKNIPMNKKKITKNMLFFIVIDRIRTCDLRVFI